jgi:hypothetical protein
MAGWGELVRHRRYAELPGVDLQRARYVRKTSVHTHEYLRRPPAADPLLRGCEAVAATQRRGAATA